MKKGRKANLVQKVLLVFVILALVLILAISALSFFRYRREILDTFTALAADYARAGAAFIDGDRIPAYLKSGETDAYYEEVSRFLNIEAENSDMKCYYVIVPQQDDYVYIWDANSARDAGDAYPLGYREAYSGKGKELVDEVFTKDPVIRTLTDTNVDYGRVICLYYPIFDGSGEPVALVGVELSLPELYTSILRVIGIIVLSMIPIVILALLIAFWYLRKNIVHPVQMVSDAALHITEYIDEDETVSIPVHTGDEIEDLARSFEGMERALKEYIKKLSEATAERERARAELDVAAQIQSDILPAVSPGFSGRQDFDLSASMTPAREVGGDFYDFFMVDEDRIALVIADVSDKGVPAALFMVIAKTLLKNALRSGMTPGAALESVNNQLCENNRAGMFVTAWAGVFSISEGRLLCANAGHEYPILCRKGGSFELFRDRHGLVLAGMENTRYREYTLTLSPGDTIFLYTDGVTEAADGRNQLFCTERLLQILNQKKTDSCEGLIGQVYEGIHAFVQDAPQFDDITMLCLHVKAMRKALQISAVTAEKQPLLTSFIETAFGNWQVPQKAVVKMNIALDEIYSNIVRYAHAGCVRVVCGVSEDTAFLRFEDDGVPFNPLEEEEADTALSSAERKIGGLGILTVRKSMDEMDYQYTDRKNILTLKIRLPK